MIEVEKTSTNLYWHRLRLAEILEVEPDELVITEIDGKIQVQFANGSYEIDKSTIEAAFDEAPPKTTDEEIQEIQDAKIIETLERVKEKQGFKDVFEPLIKAEIDKDKLK